MQQKPQRTIADVQLEIVAEVVERFQHDPFGFVNYAFPWGEGQLKNQKIREWQEELLISISSKLKAGTMTVDEAIQEARASGHGIGKQQPKSLKINRIILNSDMEAINKEEINWGDLKKGDYVFGSDGKPTEIIQTHEQGVNPIYRITFDDGSSTLCGLEHLWNVRGRQQRRNGIKDFITVSTREILGRGVLRSNGIAKAKQWEIPIQGAVQFAYSEVFDPYTVGVWIGDGCSVSGRITSTREELWPKMGIRPNKDTPRYRKDRVMAATPPGLLLSLKSNNMIPVTCDTKFIADCYKYNSEPVRRDLVGGMLDSDGEVNSCGSIGYSSTSKQLVEDLIWMVRSLGGKAMMQPTVKKAGYRKDGVYHECKDCYRCTINFGGKWNPFTHTDKKAAFKSDIQHRYLCRWIESIEYSHDEEAMCITVEAEDGLYLTNDFIVTHNSAFVAWILLWAMSTREHTKGVVTANTETQLRTKTWAELSKWYSLCITKFLFKLTATALFSSNPEWEKTWRIDAIPWSERNTEAFAGLHNEGKRIILIFDEASAIPDVIWEVSEGALTDENTEIIWCVFGNPTRNTGRFRECFGKYKHRWTCKQIDSRTVPGVNLSQIAKWVTDYGEDSDFVRVRVRGVFPRAGSNQLISTEVVTDARLRSAEGYELAAKILSVDIARHGDDQSALVLRQGSKVHWIRRYRIPDLMQLSSKVGETITECKPDVTVLDATGMGAGVYDRLKSLRYNVVAVIVGERALEPERFYNLRSELWWKMREWFTDSAADIPDETEIEADLTNIEYGYDNKERMQLETKKDMKKRGLSSPDAGDALAMSFSVNPIKAKEVAINRYNLRRNNWRTT